MSFSAVLTRITHNRCVDVPQEISSALVEGGRISVEVDVLGERFPSTLVPRGGGLHRLFIPAAVCRKNQFDSGDAIPVRIRPAPPPPAKIPDEIREAGAGHPEALAEYARLSPADRRQVAKMLASAKKRGQPIAKKPRHRRTAAPALGKPEVVRTERSARTRPAVSASEGSKSSGFRCLP